MASVLELLDAVEAPEGVGHGEGLAVQVAADVRGLLVEHRLDAVLPDARLGVAAHLRVGAALRDERGGDRLPVERGAVDERGAGGLPEASAMSSRPRPSSNPAATMRRASSPNPRCGGRTRRGRSCPGSWSRGDDAAVDGVELGADRQPLAAPGVGARGGDHLLAASLNGP